MLNALTVESFVRNGVMGDGCLLEPCFKGDEGLSGKDFTGVDMVGILEGDGFLGPSCAGWGPVGGWFKAKLSMALHKDDKVLLRESRDTFRMSGKDVCILMQFCKVSPCRPGNDRPGRENGAWEKHWDCRLPFLFPAGFPVGSSSWVSNDVAGLGIEGPLCFRGPARDECGRGGCRTDERVAGLVAEDATLFARPCIFAGPLTDLDVVLPPGPVFRASGDCVVLFERFNSAIWSAPSSEYPCSVFCNIRDELDCLAIVPGCMRPERELAKAEFTSFRPPGTRARVDALDWIWT